MSTFPENEASYTSEEIDRVEVVLNDEAATLNQPVNVNVSGQTLSLAREQGATYTKDLAEVDVSLLDWVGLNMMAVSFTNADGTQTEEISFELRGGEE